MDMNNPLILIPFTIFTAFLSAWIAAYYSVKGHFKQILWEKKLEVYEKLLEGLHFIKNDSIISMTKKSGQEADDTIKYYKKYAEEAFKNMDKIGDIGKLLISHKSYRIIQDLRIDLIKVPANLEEWQLSSDDPTIYISAEYVELILICIPALINESKKDLGVDDYCLSEILKQKWQTFRTFMR